MKTENISLKGTITASHGNGFYRVECKDLPNSVICKLSGKMSKGYNKPEVGDNVKFEISQTDLTKGRITHKW
jgi:translation initiation factor IF-1